MSYLKIENLYKKWDDFELNFSCSLEKGRMLGIVGHSGSGKSTILRMIAGLLPIDKNEKSKNTHIIIGNKDITDLPPGKRNIGMVFQHAALFSHMRVADNVAYGLKSQGFSKKQSRDKASCFLEQFNLAGFENRRPDSLSGGEAQRVSLARTLIVQPDVVLFDEPFASLDVPLRKKLANDILNLQKTIGFTGIIVTHDIQEAQTLCDTVTVMKKGSQVWTGNAKQFDEHLL